MMIIDLTEQNKVLAAACRQADANDMVGVLTHYWSSCRFQPPRRLLDEDEVFITESIYDCCTTRPSVLITEQEGYSRKVNGKYVVPS